MEEVVCPDCGLVLDRAIGMCVKIDLESYRGKCPCGSKKEPDHYHNGVKMV